MKLLTFPQIIKKLFSIQTRIERFEIEYKTNEIQRTEIEKHLKNEFNNLEIAKTQLINIISTEQTLTKDEIKATN